MSNSKLNSNLANLEICRLNIRLTSRCNQKCISCNTHNFVIKNELQLYEIESFIQNATKIYNIKNIAFTGGEPTFRKDFLDIVKMAKKYSPAISVTTNGYLFKNQKCTDEILCAGINRITFSYHERNTHARSRAFAAQKSEFCKQLIL